MVARRRKVRGGPEILRTWLSRCGSCELLSGYVHEKLNGLVPVYCPCQIRSLHGGRWASPSMVSLRDDRVTWTPTTDHIGADGRQWHQPWFVGCFLDKEGLGFPLVDEQAGIDSTLRKPKP